MPTETGGKANPDETGGKANPDETGGQAQPEVAALPSTGSGTSDGAGLLTVAAAAAAALTGIGAMKIRNKR